jgi:hypothetical protein
MIPDSSMAMDTKKSVTESRSVAMFGKALNRNAKAGRLKIIVRTVEDFVLCASRRVTHTPWAQR